VSNRPVDGRKNISLGATFKAGIKTNFIFEKCNRRRNFLVCVRFTNATMICRTTNLEGGGHGQIEIIFRENYENPQLG
jgi:hypothetical protein